MPAKKTIAALSVVTISGATLTVSTLGTKAAPSRKLALWTVLWGDGTFQHGNGQPPASLTHAYLANGTYDLTWTVMDNLSVSDSLIVRSVGIAASVPAPAPTPLPIPPPTPSPAGILSRADLTYVGMFRVPDVYPSINDLSYSEGHITGRRVSGVSTILITGTAYGANTGNPNQKAVVELAIPADAALTSNITTAPRTTAVRSWDHSLWGPAVPTSSCTFGANGGAVRSGLQVSNQNGPDCNYSKITGIHYAGNDFGNGTQLFYTYASAYGLGLNFPNIGAVVMRNDGTSSQYGPWGSQAFDWEHMCGALFKVPASVQAATGCGPLGVQAQVRGNAGAGPWGGSCHTFTPPSLATPTDYVTIAGGKGCASPGALNSTFRPALWNSNTHRALRNSYFKKCASILPNDCSAGGTIDPPPAVTTWGADLSTTLDWLDCAVWIEGPNKKGFIGVGQMAEQFSVASGHASNFVYNGTHPNECHISYGTNPCCHGQTNGPVEFATGPRCETIATKAWIWNPDQMVEVLKGTRPAYDVAITEEILLSSLSSVLERRTTLYQTGGVWFDEATKRLYLSEIKRDVVGFDYLPVVHVFAVNC